MCPILKKLLLVRADMARLYDVSTEAGLADAVAWMFVRALPEYGIEQLVDDKTLAALNAPVCRYPSPDSRTRTGGQQDQAVELTILMGLMWRHRTDVQPIFDISTAVGRARFTLWFITHGVNELGLQYLVSAQWRAWNLGNATVETAPLLPRLGVVAWIARPDLQAAFDIQTRQGLDGLSAWALDALENNAAWQWLKTSVQSDQVQLLRHSRWLEYPQAKFGVNLIGFARGELGIGEDVRMAAAACEAAGIPYSVVNIEPGESTGQGDSALEASLKNLSDAPYPVNVFCLTGFDTQRVFFEQGAGLFANRYNIGWWPWELPVWPKACDTVFDLVQEVWAATEFTRVMYSQATRVRVSHMPLPASVDRRKSVTRRKLGIPAGKFLFLYIFDFNSYLARKNPFAALKAFRKAFGASDGSVGLVLKTMNSDPNNRDWKRFVKECAQDARVTLLDRTLNRGEVLGLVDACDAYLSLHRSEGFGRTLAEAMLFGKPVVGTGFSGNMDFLDEQSGFPVRWSRRMVRPGEYPFVQADDQAWWAEPDLDHAAEQMRNACKAAASKPFTQSVQRYAEKQFSPQRIGLRMKTRLLEVWNQSVS
jgi:glycosyltransferase involved in cell wall biosynthesis